MLRLGAMGAAGAMLSSAASSSVLPSLVYAPSTPVRAIRWRRFRRPCRAAGAGRASIRSCSPGPRPRSTQHRICAARLDRHRRFLASRRASRASTSSTCMNGKVESHRVAHGRGSDPDHSGFVERFSNDFGSYATSNGTYIDRRLLSRQVRPFDEGPRPRLDATTTPSRARSSSTTPGMPSPT